MNPLYLIIDLGNTNKKLALFSDKKLKLLRQFPSIGLKNIRDFYYEYPGIRHCILSSVIRHPASIEKFLHARCPLLVLDAHTPLPILNRYRSPETLGKDRLAAAVGGSFLFPGQNVLVINAGTCITYDFINHKKEYIGGAVSPGMDMRFRALHTFTGKLPLISLEKRHDLVGKDTSRAILSGVINGMIGEIEHITRQYLQKFPDLVVILSGGDMNYFNKRLKISIFAVPNIVIYGLHQILAFNVKNAC